MFATAVDRRSEYVTLRRECRLPGRCWSSQTRSSALLCLGAKWELWRFQGGLVDWLQGSVDAIANYQACIQVQVYTCMARNLATYGIAATTRKLCMHLQGGVSAI